MSASIEMVNTYAAKWSIGGWFAGLAYYNWFSNDAPHASLLGHVLLIVVGMIAASVLVGGSVALVFALGTKLVTGSAEGSPHGYAWGAFISPVLCFFLAKLALHVAAGL
jgi:hypothetical protein